MIHQCFFLPSQASALFTHDPYRPFGLEPEVNEEILCGCPEIGPRTVRLAVLEHAAFLWHWRNQRDTDPWIGFTSYRRLKKQFPFVFENREHVEQELAKADIVSWGLVEFNLSLSQQAEMFHPGINEYMGRLFGAFGETIRGTTMYCGMAR